MVNILSRTSIRGWINLQGQGHTPENQKIYLLQTFINIEQQDRQPTLENIQFLLHLIAKTERREEMGALLEDFSRSNASAVSSLIEKTLPLLERIALEDRHSILLSHIHNFPLEEVDPIAWVEHREKLDNIPRWSLNERETRIVRAFNQLQIDFPGGALFDTERVLELLETPLEEPLPPLHGGMAAAARQGATVINIHASGRDAQTAQALQLLRTKQDGIDEIILAASYQDCIKYLEKNDLQKALFVLQGTCSIRGDGGALNQEFPLHHFSTTGQEIMGRLWLFIDTIADEKDQENARISLIKALHKCIAAQMRVCHSGKVQRLFIAVLSGRLAGVQIDDALSIESAEEMFFAKVEHREISTLSELLEKANAFCDSNLLIPREEFLKKIKQYAKESGIE